MSNGSKGGGDVRPLGLYPRVNVECVEDFAEIWEVNKAVEKPRRVLRIHLEIPFTHRPDSDWDEMKKLLAKNKRKDAHDRYARPAADDPPPVPGYPPNSPKPKPPDARDKTRADEVLKFALSD